VHLHQGGITQRGEIDKDAAVGEDVAESFRRCQRQAGFADAARSGEGDQPHRVVAQQLAHPRAFFRSVRSTA
jgi:hypothetical protein